MENEMPQFSQRNAWQTVLRIVKIYNRMESKKVHHKTRNNHRILEARWRIKSKQKSLISSRAEMVAILKRVLVLVRKKLQHQIQWTKLLAPLNHQSRRKSSYGWDRNHTLQESHKLMRYSQKKWQDQNFWILGKATNCKHFNSSAATRSREEETNCYEKSTSYRRNRIWTTEEEQSVNSKKRKKEIE